MKHLILGTAGHIDHGKTTLIQKLTGADTDRLAEEQERGISIDLGFTSFELEDEGIELGIIDVPGHEKFVKNMLAGAGGIDLALLVVAADEGFMPQTEEHLNILELLGVEEGVVALTKVDTVEEEWLELVKEDTKDNLAGTFLEEAALVPVSGVTGTGIEKLIAELTEIAKGMEPKNQDDNVYYPLDRSFSIDGFGTVVTGTLMAGKLQEGDKGIIYPQQEEVEVKNLHVHGEAVEEAVAGQRVGTNLADVDVDDISRGDILAEPHTLDSTTLMDVKLELLPDAPLSLEQNERLRIHLGAKEVFGRISILNKETIYPGEEAYVQLRLEESMVAYYNQPFVIRRYSPVVTVGGGRVLLPRCGKHKRFNSELLSKLQIQEEGSDLERIEVVIQDYKQTVKPKDLMIEIGLTVDEIKDKCVKLVEKNKIFKFTTGQQVSYLHYNVYSRLKDQVVEALKEYHRQYHLRWGRAKEEVRSQLQFELSKQEYDQFLSSLEEEGVIEIKKADIKLTEHEIKLTEQEEELKNRIEDEFRNNSFMPPTLPELQQKFEVEEELIEDLFDLLVCKGRLKRINAEIYLHYETLNEARERLKDFLADNGEITLAEYRDLLDSSRKYTLPLLNYFDQQGVTKRVGDKRILAE
ncbi:selenocysteine-specific translation elongation factor [Acetohalobium arabaticum]|uniref:Selenocysteine-specific elongation factor n=1 Tax=Acetohalobium arabaticum (strain ATCC 49924 / DSM 5501 / Z-7288) TaxID=574087 RepID=D9QUG5_ACEAZ|nr:selenocysteine-specific translation elongation factor [Acetohalobium arabaticum]ADL13766.1 selenocysteine-specific translation elongation factor [Acetohalobium arabaticum DSM 5501]